MKNLIKKLEIPKLKSILLFSLLFLLYCNGMSENQVKTLTKKEVYSRSKVIEMFQISAISLQERCVKSRDALNYLINEGFSDEFTRPFYKKSSVDACNILFLGIECPNFPETSANISYYKSLIYHCKVKPVELFQ